MCVAKFQTEGSTEVDKQTTLKRVQMIDMELKSGNLELNYDLLSSFTNYTKKVISVCCSVYENCKNLHFVRFLMKTTQPAHLLTLIFALILAKILFTCEKPTEISPPTTITKLIYLASFAIHFGNQIWMTFVSGLSLYLCLPRHTFGDVQKILFPKYFFINAILSLITLFTFLKCQDVGSNSNSTQVTVLVVCFCIELIIRLYMTPRLLKLMTEKNQLEVQAGVGMEIGKHDPGHLAKCPVYVRLHSAFRKVHMTIAIGNMATMACTALHLFYLADKLTI